MTAAFNLAQLANNLNTSGQLDATDGLSGLVANSNLASSGTASSSTFLRGDRTWNAIPSSFTYGTNTAMSGVANADFTGIPSNAKRITVLADKVSNTINSINGSLTVRLGDSGGIEATGYQALSIYWTAGQWNETGFFTYYWSSNNQRTGRFVLDLMDATTNTWLCQGFFTIDPLNGPSGGNGVFVVGIKSLSATLDRIRVGTYDQASTFTSGNLRMFYEV